MSFPMFLFLVATWAVPFGIWKKNFWAGLWMSMVAATVWAAIQLLGGVIQLL